MAFVHDVHTPERERERVRVCERKGEGEREAGSQHPA
jgi:hypothetical protein